MIARLQEKAINSSHYIWLLTDLQFFETRSGYLFAYSSVGRLTFVALEPLEPANGSSNLAAALEEFKAATHAKTLAFIGIYEPFMAELAKLGYHGLRVGKDPWVNLGDGEPTGKKAKGIRSARNHAIKAGVRVEEWDLAALGERRHQIEKIHKTWIEAGFLELEGFLLASDPLRPVDGRRLFVSMREDGKAEGFLMVMPVKPGKRYYFEDMMCLPSAPNGSTELLMLTAMAALRESGAEEVSLGVVSLNELGFYVKPGSYENKFKRTLLRTATRISHQFYNSEGIELHRKRFQPAVWRDIYIALQDKGGEPGLFSWLKVLFASLELFKPKFKFSFGRIFAVLGKMLRKHQAVLLWMLAYGPLVFLHSPERVGAIILILVCAAIVHQVHALIRGQSFFWTMLAGWILTALAFPHPGTTGHVPQPLIPALYALGLYASQRIRPDTRGSVTLMLLLVAALLMVFKPAAPVIPWMLPIALFGAGVLAGKINFQIYRRQSNAQSKGKSVGAKGLKSVPHASEKEA